MMLLRCMFVSHVLFWMWGASAFSQTALQDLPLSPAQAPNGVLVIDLERLFSQSNYGAAVRDIVRTRNAQLEHEDELLYEQLQQEVALLTEKRQTLEPEDFRVEAQAFDDKVSKIRAEQDAKEAALNSLIANSNARFVNSVRPLLDRLRVERAALVLLDQRIVLLSDPSIDITDAAIAAVNAQMAQGILQVPEVVSGD